MSFLNKETKSRIHSAILSGRNDILASELDDLKGSYAVKYILDYLLNSYSKSSGNKILDNLSKDLELNRVNELLTKSLCESKFSNKNNWSHKSDCNKYICYCLDDCGDPICVCGNPGWACECDNNSDYLVEK